MYLVCLGQTSSNQAYSCTFCLEWYYIITAILFVSLRYLSIIKLTDKLLR
jgi:hypothetical protein